jgi:hypothetical protein
MFAVRMVTGVARILVQSMNKDHDTCLCVVHPGSMGVGRGQTRAELRRSSAAPPTWPGLTTVQSLAVASQFGLTLPVGVGVGLLAGRWLDGVLDSGLVMTLIGAIAGLASGIVSIVGLYRATLRRSALEWRADHPSPATGAPDEVN